MYSFWEGPRALGRHDLGIYACPAIGWDADGDDLSSLPKRTVIGARRGTSLALFLSLHSHSH